MAIQWTQASMPNLNGVVAVVTGANSGIGFEATAALATHGAHVVMACRSLEKGVDAAAAIRRADPTASVDVSILDLADLQSVRAFAHTFYEAHDTLDLLINNAGIMASPQRETADGFELQFGVNHLGHFALTGLLLPSILHPGARPARIVTVSSGVHERGRINFDDLQSRESYNPWAAYGQSKLANLLFAYELQRRLAAAGEEAISVGAHPGYAATNLQSTGPGMDGSRLAAAVMAVTNRIFAQSAEMGALPILYAATAAGVQGCDYIGPGGFMGGRGYPEKVRSSDASYDREAAARLWAVSAELTGVDYALLQAQPEAAG